MNSGTQHLAPTLTNLSKPLHPRYLQPLCTSPPSVKGKLSLYGPLTCPLPLLSLCLPEALGPTQVHIPTACFLHLPSSVLHTSLPPANSMPSSLSWRTAPFQSSALIDAMWASPSAWQMLCPSVLMGFSFVNTKLSGLLCFQALSQTYKVAEKLVT